MSSARSAPPISLELIPSRIFLIGAALSHLLAAASLFAVDLPVGVMAALALLIAASLIFVYACYGHARSPWFIARATWSSDGQWTLRGADGREQSARLQGYYLHPQLVILNFSLGRFRRRSLVLLPDASDPEAIRRLRVRLLTTRQDEDLAPADRV